MAALAPLDCTQAQVSNTPDDDGSVIVSALYKSVAYNLRICVKDRNGNISRGRILSAATIGYSPPASSSNASTNPISNLLNECTQSIYAGRVPDGQTEIAETKLCRCSGFLNSGPFASSKGPFGPNAAGAYAFGTSPCTAATQQGVIAENDNDMPIKLTIYTRNTGTYEGFIGKKMNGAQSRTLDTTNQKVSFMFKVEKP